MSSDTPEAKNGGGLVKCPRPCADCVDPKTYVRGSGGPHHWLPESLDLDDLDDEDRDEYPGPIAAGVTSFWACRHCDAWKPYDPEDDGDADES